MVQFFLNILYLNCTKLIIQFCIKLTFSIFVLNCMFFFLFQSMKEEKSTSLQILESINNKKPKFNLEKAANKAIHAEEVQ